MKAPKKPFMKVRPSVNPMAKGAPKRAPALPPPQSEDEAPDAAPIMPPIQTSSTPKMAQGNAATGLSMRKPIKD